ncbi:MAG: hypothetical protein AAGG48_31025 [Planctomycetota bacterium]
MQLKLSVNHNTNKRDNNGLLTCSETPLQMVFVLVFVTRVLRNGACNRDRMHPYVQWSDRCRHPESTRLNELVLSVLRFSLIELMILTVGFALLTWINLKPVEVGSGEIIYQVGWPMPIQTSTVISASDVIPGARAGGFVPKELAADSKSIVLEFSRINIAVNVVTAIVISVCTVFLMRLIRVGLKRSKISPSQT